MRILSLAAVLILLLTGADAAAGQGRSEAANDADPSCVRVRTGVEGPCSVSEYVLRRLHGHGLPAALATLDSLARHDGEVRRLGHAYAHAVGIAAYREDREVGRVFGECSAIFQSGCYHGVIQAYFADQGQGPDTVLDAAAIEGLCADQRARPDGRWMLFQCVHGLGHGLMMLVRHQLPQALGGCDLLSSLWEREICYSAVFMENVVHATSAEGSLGRPGTEHAGHGGRPGWRTEGSAGVVADFPNLDPDDPLYPCTVLEDRYLLACYQMQTSAILQRNGFDVREAAAICARGPERFRTTCFQSLGRDISGLTVQEHGRAMALCGHAVEAYRPFCHLGYAKNLVDVTADPADGFAFCRLLEEGESKRLCYVGMGEELWVLHEAPERRAEACDVAEPGYVEACRDAAGLPRSLPDLPAPQPLPALSPR